MQIHSSASGVLACFSISNMVQKSHHYQGFTITNTPHSAGILRTSYQPDAETSTWQHSTLTIPRRDSSPQSREASGCNSRLRRRGHWMWRATVTSRMLRVTSCACTAHENNAVYITIHIRQYRDELCACVKYRLILSLEAPNYCI